MPATARFCPSCGHALATTPPPVDRERRRISAVFVDLVGSTAAADIADPEDVGKILELYYGAVERELARHGGTLEKYIGDAVVAVFGVPVAHEDDETRAVGAAVAARDAVRALEAGDARLELHVRIGIATGEALVAVGGLAERGENLAAGDVMNTAARLQSLAPTDGVVVDGETARAVERNFRLEPLGDVDLKGKAAAVSAFVVVARSSAPSRHVADTRLVGRDHELSELETTLAAVVAEGRAQSVVVVGEPGIGKSRLLAELEARSHARWIHGTCLAYGEGITYWPLARALGEAAGALVDERAHDVEAVAALAARLTAGCSPGEQAAVSAAIATVIGSSLEGEGEPAPITRGELHRGIRRALELLAGSVPLVLVVEDVHWAEESLLALLEFLASSAKPLALLMTSRPEGAPKFEVDRCVRLQPLDARACAALVEELGGSPLGGAARQELVERGGGNPLFLEELLRAARAGAGADVPRTLGALIGARLDRLPREVRTIAGIAAVVGTAFWEGAVRALADDGSGPGPEALVAAELARPSARSMLVAEREFTFLHGVLRDVAYARLPKARRASLHLSCARWLSERGEDADELVELVAAHLEQACLVGGSLARRPFDLPVADAVAALERGADRAERREGFAEASRFVARAIEVERLDRADASCALRLRLARLQIALGRLDDARAMLDDVVPDASREADARVEGLAFVLRANVRHKLGSLDAARDDLGLARRTAERIGDAELEARAGFELATILDVYDGDLRGAIRVLGDALVAADRAGTLAIAVEGRLRMGFLLFDAGDLAGAEAVLWRMIQTAEEAGYRREAARGRFELAVVRSLVTDDDGEAEALAAAAHEVALLVDDAYFVPQVARFRAELALERDDLDSAERLTREAFAAAQAVGGWCIVDAGAVLVRTLVRTGAVAEAEVVLGAMRDALPESDAHARASVLAAEATVEAAHGGNEGAWRDFAEAVRVVDGLENPLASAFVRWQAARVLPLHDPRVSALLDEAVEIWTIHHAHRMVERAEALRAAAARVRNSPTWFG